MSDVFNLYEDSVNEKFTKIANITNNMQNLSREKTESAINEANHYIQEAQTLLKKLELEASSNVNKERLIMKVKNIKSEFNNLKQAFLKKQNQYINAKSNEALYLNSDDVNDKNLVDNEELAYHQNSKLDKALGNVLEIEHRGNEVMRQLDHQTNIMNKVNNNIDDMNYQLGDSNSLIGKMMKRENRNKVVILIAIIFFAIILIIIATAMTSGGSEENYNYNNNSSNTNGDNSGFLSAVNIVSNSSNA